MSDVSPFSRDVLSRLPLATAVLTVSAHVLAPEFLDDFFARNAAGSYQGAISFPHFLDLVGDALLRRDGSLCSALEHHGDLAASKQAYYGKLRRIPLPLSVALLREAAGRLRPLVAAGTLASLPASLAGYEVRMIDGKKLKRVAKRLLASRGTPGKLFGGKLLVSWDPRSGLADAMAAHPDGEANECVLVPALLGQLPAAEPGRPWLLVADRQFGDLVQPGRFFAAGRHFLVRRNAKTRFHPCAEMPAQHGTDARGRRWEQQWGWLGSGPGRRFVRQVTLLRAGAEHIHLVTDLTDGQAVPAEDLLEVYLRRWGIEEVFQQITEVFGLARFIGSSEQATVFQASYCLLLYDLIVVVKGYVAQAGACPVGQTSTKKLFADLREELVSLFRLVPRGELLATLEARPGERDIGAWLREVLATTWRPRYHKASDAKPRPPRPKRQRSGAHTSIFRLRNKHRDTNSQTK